MLHVPDSSGLRSPRGAAMDPTALAIAAESCPSDPFSHACAVPSMVRESWNFRALCQVGSVLPKAFAAADVNDDGEEEFLVGTSEGSFIVLKHSSREPMLHCTSLTTVSVVLWEAALKTLIVVCLEGTCHIIPNFSPSISLDLFRPSTTIPPNCSCGVIRGDRVFLGSSNRRVYVYTIVVEAPSQGKIGGNQLAFEGGSSPLSLVPKAVIPDIFTASVIEEGDYFFNAPIFSVDLFERQKQLLLMVATTSSTYVVRADREEVKYWSEANISQHGGGGGASGGGSSESLSGGPSASHNRHHNHQQGSFPVAATGDDNAALHVRRSLWRFKLKDTRLRLADFGTPTPTVKALYDSACGSLDGPSGLLGGAGNSAVVSSLPAVATTQLPPKALAEMRLPIAVDCLDVGHEKTYAVISSEDGFVSLYCFLDEETAGVEGATGPNSKSNQHQSVHHHIVLHPPGGTKSGVILVTRLWETRLDPLIQRALVMQVKGSVCVVTCTTSGILHVMDRSLNVLTAHVSTEMISVAPKKSNTKNSSDLTLMCAALDEIFEVAVPTTMLGENSCVATHRSTHAYPSVSMSFPQPTYLSSGGSTTGGSFGILPPPIAPFSSSTSPPGSSPTSNRMSPASQFVVAPSREKFPVLPSPTSERTADPCLPSTAQRSPRHGIEFRLPADSARDPVFLRTLAQIGSDKQAEDVLDLLDVLFPISLQKQEEMKQKGVPMVLVNRKRLQRLFDLMEDGYDAATWRQLKQLASPQGGEHDLSGDLDIGDM